MKRICATILLAAAFLAVSPGVSAQKFVPAEVTVSKNKVEIDGRTFYVHPVLAKQTLYSICKAYGADLEEVKQINAGELSGGLKTGSMLLIPVGAKPAAAEETAVVSEPAAQETVTVKQEKKEEEGVRYIRHRVKWYDSLLMLALKYKVSQEDIIEANNLDSKTLVVGQILKIPIGTSSLEDIDDNEMVDVEEEDDVDDITDTGVPTITITDTEEEPFDIVPKIVPFSGTANMALVLPFSSGSNSPSANFLDFYSGVLLALEDLRQDGTNINLKVLDMADFGSPEQLIASTPTDLDFIIANFSMQSIEPAARWCDRHHIPLVSPLDQKIEAATYDHKYLINTPLSASTQTMRMAEAIGYNPRKDNVVVVCENSENPGQFHAEVINSLDSLGIPYTIAKCGFGRVGENLRNVLLPGKKNHVILTCEKESLAADAVRNIGYMAKSGTFNIVGYASHRIRRFESIDNDALRSMNAHFFMGYYVDYSDENVKDFVRRYRALYNADPGNFSFQGYDVAMYFGSALKLYGSDMINGIGHYPSQGLQLNFRFDRRNDTGGMFNEATKNLAY